MSLILKKTRQTAVGVMMSLGLVGATAACTVSTPDTPAISGPSEFGTSITLSASPEVLAQDGTSQAVITALVRDEASRPVSGVTIRWEAWASTTRVLPVNLSSLTSTSNADGRATVVLTAPVTPTVAPGSPDFITVYASPVSGSVDGVEQRTVRVQLQPPAGVPVANLAPIAAFTIKPSVALVGETVTFDARTTMDEGEPCLSRCTYLWNFGDETTASGMVVEHSYGTIGSYTVTLTVVDDRQGVDSPAVPPVITVGPIAP